MMNVPKWLLILLCAASGSVQSQPILFSQCYGGSGNEERCMSMIDAPPGVIMTGRTNSTNGDVSGFHGSIDGWVMRTDAAGSVMWAKCYGGNNDEGLMRTIITTDGNLLHVGYSNAVNGDVTKNYGLADFWVIKTDTTGNILWQKSYGGANIDCAYSAIDMSDGTYIVAGISHSLDSMITSHHGTAFNSDVWIIKINANDGRLLWERSYGGTESEGIATTFAYRRLMTMIPYDATSFAFTVSSASSDGDVTNAQFNVGDYWLVKADTSGAILFEYSYGGSQQDVSYNLAKTPDNGFVVVGATTSNDGDVTGYHSTAMYPGDYWVVKTDAVGTLQWQRCCGGVNYEDAYGVCVTWQGCYVIGRTESIDGDVLASGWHGGNDYWVAFLDYNGTLLWDKCLGGTSFDEAIDVLITSDGKLTCAGNAGSSDGDVLSQHGGFDFWLVKLDDVTGVFEQQIENATLSLFPNPGGDKVYVTGADAECQVVIYNNVGQVMRTSSLDRGAVDCADLPEGIYEFIVYRDANIVGRCSWIKTGVR